MESLNKKTLFDRVVGSMAQSKPMNQFNSWIASGFILRGTPASPEFQKMGADAQIAVGIPAERQVPIRFLEPEDEHDGGLAQAEAIYLYKDTFDNADTSYGVNRCIIHHEAVHIKYNDEMAIAPFLATGLMSGPVLTKLIKPDGKLNILYPLSMIAGVLAGRWLAGKYLTSYCERRADIEGHYATQCSTCVQESANNLKEKLTFMHKALEVLKNDEEMEKRISSGLVTQADRENAINTAQDFINTKKHYLSPDELEQIALDLKQQGKVCTFHNACKAPIINRGFKLEVQHPVV
jgi:hypothetical protein